MADLRQYEVMVILDPDLDERTVARSLDTYLNVVRQSGGTLVPTPGGPGQKPWSVGEKWCWRYSSMCGTLDTSRP